MDQIGADAHLVPVERKKTVRRLALQRRDELTGEQRLRKSEAVGVGLIDLPEVQVARTVLAFASFRSEVLTDPFLHWCSRRGKCVGLPRIEGPRHMEAFQVEDVVLDLRPGFYEIPEPASGLPQLKPGDIDVILVPGSAFDRRGGRLGYGGGFYDTYMSRAPQAFRVAVGFATQLVDEVPAEDHDLRVDALVTETGVLRFPRASAL